MYGKVNWEFLRANAYADLQYRHVGYTMDGPTDKWDGTKQISYDLDDHFDFFNPKFGINWDITPNNHKLYVSYAIAHKEPTRNDYEDNIGVNMKAERLNDLELGYKYLRFQVQRESQLLLHVLPQSVCAHGQSSTT